MKVVGLARVSYKIFKNDIQVSEKTLNNFKVNLI